MNDFDELFRPMPTVKADTTETSMVWRGAFRYSPTVIHVPPGTCQTCKHWKPDQTSYPADVPYGRCTGILTDHDGDTGRLAALSTPPYLGADLDTLPTFGCALHETAETPGEPGESQK